MKTHDHGAQIDTEAEPDCWAWICDMAKAARDLVLWSAALGLLAWAGWKLLA